MYKMIRSSNTRQLIGEHGLAAASALLIADLFYKFGSFALECLAFLATWGVIEFLLVNLWERARTGTKGKAGEGAGAGT